MNKKDKDIKTTKPWEQLRGPSDEDVIVHDLEAMREPKAPIEEIESIPEVDSSQTTYIKDGRRSISSEDGINIEMYFTDSLGQKLEPVHIHAVAEFDSGQKVSRHYYSDHVSLVDDELIKRLINDIAEVSKKMVGRKKP